jgi:SAM-dependent methyltransferase
LEKAPDNDRWALLCCARCGGSLVPGPSVACGSCDARYPLVDGIPWLCAEPEATLGEWRTRMRALTTALQSQAARYRAALDATITVAATRNRLKLLSSACSDHARRLSSLLAPLDVAAAAAVPETYQALGAPLPAGQGLTGYYANLHRDWCWGAAENDAAYAAVDRALGAADPGRTLVLGCGAGRLAYDLHVRRGMACTIAADLNPLMMIVARRMFEGGHVELYEFPLAPRDLGCHAVLRELRAPAPAPQGLWPVVADASRAPFADGAFDTVVTPWLIDILDEDFAAFAARLNQWLRPGGRWVNSGSLFFQHGDPARCYSTDELPELLQRAGFGDVGFNEEVVPYLASPASRHARMERLVTFGAVVRTRVNPPPQHRNAPHWLERDDVPVPLLPQVESQALAMRVHSFVASLVDGHRTLRDIADVLVRERLMPADESQPAVRAFLQRLFADAQASWRP